MDELAIEISKSQVGLHLLDVLRNRPLQDSRNLSWIHPYPLHNDHITHESHLVFVKLTLLHLGVQLVFPQDCQDAADGGNVLSQGPRVDYDVIKDADCDQVYVLS